MIGLGILVILLVLALARHRRTRGRSRVSRGILTAISVLYDRDEETEQPAPKTRVTGRR